MTDIKTLLTSENFNAGAVLLGERGSEYGPDKLWLYESDRLRHFYTIGKSGAGKSTLLFNMLVQDILFGRGACLIDPHGDLAASVLEHIPRGRTREVTFLDLGNPDNFIAWNPLEVTRGLSPSTIAFNVTSALKHIWRESWGPRMEYILTNCLFALSERGEPIINLPRLLSDQNYRRKITAKLTDLKVKHFFEVEFEGFDEKQRTEFVLPIQNKVGLILTHESVRRLFAVKKSKFNLRSLLDRGGLLIVNLAKGKVGEEPANLCGSIILSLLTAAAMGRADIPEEEREAFMVFVDEFQNFTTDSFASALSEIRKYGIGLTLANQYLEQLHPSIKSAVFGNAQTKVFFAVGPNDAEALRLETRPYPETLLFEQGQGQALFSDGGGACSRLKTLAPINTHDFHKEGTGSPMAKTGRAKEIKQESQNRFGLPIEEVDELIQKAFASRPKQSKKPVLYWQNGKNRDQ